MTEQIRQRAVGYVRVSTTQQVVEGHSIQQQQDQIMRYCTYKNLDLVKIYDRDAGKSGGEMEKRFDLHLMLSELEKDMVVIVVSISRLSRSIKDTQDIIEKIKNAGASLVILDLDVDTSKATGQLMLNVMSALSQFERHQTAERISNTLQNMSRNGKLQTKPRFGYSIIKNGKISELVENKEEQEVINKIRNIITEDPLITVAQITRMLQSQGVKIRKSKQPYPASVKKIIAENNLR